MNKPHDLNDEFMDDDEFIEMIDSNVDDSLPPEDWDPFGLNAVLRGGPNV